MYVFFLLIFLICYIDYAVLHNMIILLYKQVFNVFDHKIHRFQDKSR